MVAPALGYAQGPFVLAPLSEIYGRVAVLQYANLVYLAFNTACGFCTTKQQMLAFRFLSGIGGSAPQAVSTSTPHTHTLPLLSPQGRLPIFIHT